MLFRSETQLALLLDALREISGAIEDNTYKLSEVINKLDAINDNVDWIRINQ